MSADARDEAAEPAEPAPREPKGHRELLTQRDVFEMLLRDMALRPYVFAALGSLAMIFLVMFLGGSDIGAVIVVLFGMATIVFRWVAGPPFWLIILFYFQLFPFGVPDPDSLIDNPREVYATHFRVADVVLVMAILVYLRSTYRIFGLLLQSVPFENMFRRKGEHPLRRPLGHIEPGEIVWMIGVAAALVIVGQLVWWLVNAIEFTPAEEDFPFHWADPDMRFRFRRGNRDPGEFRPGASRFFVILGVLFFGLLLIRLVFGYWRLRQMSAAEGAMVLTDEGWGESHRERVRVEKWRIWGVEKAKEEAKKEARADRERQGREDARRARAEREQREREERARRRAEREARARDRWDRDEYEDDDRPRRRE